ncbi:MAG: protein translocase subunit SecD [Planctomycetales bacterium]|nr:protein translocase subunit SecD [Planctomycetales bacterium]
MTELIQFVYAIAWVFGLFVAPFLVGSILGKTLRVKDLSFKIGLVLCMIVLAVAPFVWRMFETEQTGYRDAAGAWVSAENVKNGEITKTGEKVQAVALSENEVKSKDGRYVLEGKHEADIVVDHKSTFEFGRWQGALKYGIDLAGGTNLVYELEETEANKIESDTMKKMVGAINRRINPSGTNEVIVRQVGRNRIEVIIPGANTEAVEATKKAMTRLGSLEFAILASTLKPEHNQWIQQAKKDAKAKDVRVAMGEEGKTVVIASWKAVKQKPGPDGKMIPTREFSESDPEIAVRPVAGSTTGQMEVLVIGEPDSEKRITGKLLRRADSQRDQSGRPAVGFHFNHEGGVLFNQLTTRYRPQKDGSRFRLAILLDDQIQSAPSIKSPIGADGIIEGDFTEADVTEQINVLNAGALPVPLKKDPISEFTISPTLGADVQSKGKLALVVSAVAVVAFMGIYYLFAGVVADIAMLLNLLFIVAIMAVIDAAFTLPGLAGLVLSAGMAVDANVLIYERIREELHRGSSLRMAIHNGFDKALTAIIDSNLTTVITAVILYGIGTEQVRGFAVTLFIGLIINIFTAVYISRLVLNIAEKNRWTKLKMMSAIGETKLDFVAKQNLAIGASVVLIVAGLVTFFVRGRENYDIDFTGGTMVSMQFTQPQETDSVRKALEQSFGGDITLEELTRTGETQRGLRFRLRTTDQDEQGVEKKINDTFPDKLARVTLDTITFGQPEVAVSDDKAVEKPVVTSDYHVDLVFSADIAPSTLLERVAKHLDANKYPNAEGLLALDERSSTAIKAAKPTTQNQSGSVKLFNQMRFDVRSSLAQADLEAGLKLVQKDFSEKPVFEEVNSFESSVAAETKQSAVLAIIASLIAIIVYVWFRFERAVFGIAAVIALAHDVLVTLGMLAMCSYLDGTPIGSLFMLNDFKINMAMIAAFLTIVGYSINDTIVIFDRLREIRGKNPHVTRDMINLAVNQCLGRTILTATTVFLTVLILYILGGEGIHGFAFAMVIGSIAGTYSTVYIASPLVLWLMDREQAAASKAKEGRRSGSNGGKSVVPGAA